MGKLADKRPNRAFKIITGEVRSEPMTPIAALRTYRKEGGNRSFAAACAKVRFEVS
jgi:hypothetical protein